MKWKLLSALILSSLLLVSFVFIAKASDSGFLFPSSAANDATVGTIDWLNPTHAETDDSSTDTTCAVRGSGGTTDNSARLFIGGVVAGNDLKTGASLGGGTSRTYGGATELWGLTPSVAQINATDFGFGWSITGNLGVGKYLYVSTFGFAIPAGATINGIEVSVDYTDPAGTVLLDSISIKVYYTEAAAPTIVQSQVRIENGSVKINNGSIIMK